VGRVRVRPIPNITVDIFVTHTAADPDPSYGYTNDFYRRAQVKELIEYISKSDADVVILGGDFNAGPDNSLGISMDSLLLIKFFSLGYLFPRLTLLNSSPNHDKQH